jgi:glycine dehydrogenase
VVDHKFWPSVGRLNNVLGDRKLVCSCPSIEEYMTPEPTKAAVA